MTTAFRNALAFTLEWEAGLVDDPNDRGGMTNFGISQTAYPDEDIAAMTRERAVQIYVDDYWNKIRGDALPPGVAFAMFDYAVNSGVYRATIALQGAVHVKQDGVIGPATLHALSFYSALDVVTKIMQARGLLLVRLAKRSPSYRASINGWTRRVLACATKAGALT